MVPEPELDDDTQRLELHLAAADHVALPAIEVVSIDQDWVEATRALITHKSYGEDV